MGQAILLAALFFTAWVIRRDTRRRDGISAALWIPTLWVGVIASRPLSAWVGFGGGSNTLEGSPVDRLFFLVLIVLALLVLARRGLDWGLLLSRNWPLFLFFGYFLVSVIWADQSVVSFKRWFKDIGSVFVALVVLTEVNPRQAIGAVFTRCAYLFFPLSVVFIRYFPGLGRHYNPHSGMMEATGVTFQKNTLGVLLLVFGLVFLWDWLGPSDEPLRGRRSPALEKLARLVVLGSGLWLLILSDSKTSMACMLIGGSIIMFSRLPWVRPRIGKLGKYALVAVGAYYLLDSWLGLTEMVVTAMGRDMTFTGRTEVWREIFELKTNPIIGTGFCSIWSNQEYLMQLPSWVGTSAHCGYIETWLDGGWIGVGFLALLLVTMAVRIHRDLAVRGDYAVFQFAVLAVALIGNFSESHFGRLGPIWFLLLMCAIEPRSIRTALGWPAEEALGGGADPATERDRYGNPVVSI